MTYEQAYIDHKYLWAIGPADDMTGGYVDQEDLERMLTNPTKAMAKKCLRRQIEYWFDKGMDPIDLKRKTLEQLKEEYPRLEDIMHRHHIFSTWEG